MPAYYDNVNVGKKYDRRIRVSEEDIKIMHELRAKGISIHEISRRMGVSKRTVQFRLFPERYQLNQERAKANKAWLRYYDRDKWRETQREHRAYKKSLIKKGLIK